jgi:hypothetical protein
MSDVPVRPDPNEDLAVAVWAKYRQGPVRRYKGRGVGPAKAKRCVACFPCSVAGEVVPLSHGIVIVLCADHRDVRFIQSRGGRDFLAAFATIFDSVGLTGRRYHEAITRFVDQVRARSTPTPRRRPGSYAWVRLRTAAERVWESGGAYHDGEMVVLRGFLDLQAGVTRPPSPQTIRRWWSQRRWISRRPGEEPLSPPRERVVLIDRRVTRILIPPSDPSLAPDPADHWFRVRRRR